MRSALKNNGESGFALIATLGIMSVLSVMVASFSFMARTELKINAWQRNAAQTYYAARAGLHRTAEVIKAHWSEEANGPGRSWWADPLLYKRIDFNGTVYSVFPPGAAPERDKDFGLDDEESRLNINMATPEMLMAFPAITSVLAEEILIYRVNEEKKKGLTQGQGAILSAPITSIQELLAVPGMTRDALYSTAGEYGSLADNMTCFSSGQVNINTARPGVLLSLGFSSAEVDLIMRHRQMDDQPFSSLDTFFETLGVDKDRLKETMKWLTVKSTNFRFNCMARIPGQRTGTLIAARLSMGESSMGFTMWSLLSREDSP